MLSPLRSRFGIPGVISVIALVFAMLGGAYAANDSGGGGKATASAKAKKGPRGPKGATGPAGPTGPAGANGKDGANGSNGKDGAQGSVGPQGPPGSAGSAGAPGKSVLVEEIPAELGETTCDEQGGAEYEVEGSGEQTVICNGKEGSPWTANGTLPPGAVETGSYVTTGSAPQKIVTEYKEGPVGEEETKKEEFTIGSNEMFASISFPIPLATNIPGAHIFYGFGTAFEGETEFTKNCPGKSSSAPAVLHPGDLCIFRSPIADATFIRASQTPFGGSGAGVYGTYLEFEPIEGGGKSFAVGSFAVKGCSLTEEATKCP
jgi:hypothetical protein